MDLSSMPYPACTIVPLACPSVTSLGKVVQPDDDALSTQTSQRQNSPSQLSTVWSHAALEAYLNPTGQKLTVATKSTIARESDTDTMTKAVHTTHTVTPPTTTRPSSTSPTSPRTSERKSGERGRPTNNGKGASIEMGVGDAEPLRLRTTNREVETHTPAVVHTRSTNPDSTQPETPQATHRARTERSKRTRSSQKHGSSAPGCIQRSSAPCTTPDGRSALPTATHSGFTDWVMVDDTQATQPCAPGSVEGVDMDAEWEWEEVEVEMEVEVEVETEDEMEIVEIKTKAGHRHPSSGLARLGLPTQ